MFIYCPGGINYKLILHKCKCFYAHSSSIRTKKYFKSGKQGYLKKLLSVSKIVRNKIVRFAQHK